MTLRRIRLVLALALPLTVLLGFAATATSVRGDEPNSPVVTDETAPRDAIQPANQRRAAQFARLKAKAQREGAIPVIVEFDVPNIRALTKASNRAPRGRAGIQADARLQAAIAPVARVEAARLAGTEHAIGRTYKTIPFMALRVSEKALERLEASPRILGINEDTLERPSLDDTVDLTGASTAWTDGYDGSGWHVAILDTGLRTSHEFFAGKHIVEACFAAGEDGDPLIGDCPNGEETDFGTGSSAHHSTDPWSDHGTHVAGIATGNGPGTPAAGIGKEADLIAIQIFSQFADCEDAPGDQPCVLTFGSDQTAALEYVYLLRNDPSIDGIASVNMSIGGGFFDSEANCDAANASRKAAIDNLREIGVATAIAAGNASFCDGLESPGCISTAIGVGSTTKLDGESSFSNYHPLLLDIYAPGSGINSAEGFADDDYGFKSGTSMATPHVAGTWALMRQARPTAGVSTIFDALHATGQTISPRCGEPPTQRRIQIDAALSLLLPVEPCDIGKQVASDPADSDEFGYAVAIHGDKAAIGARLDDDQAADAGSVYVYTRTGTSWGNEVELYATDAAAGDTFGSALAMEADILVVGAENGNSGAGAVYVFSWNGTSWSEDHKLTASDAASGDRFGVAVGISGDVIAVGAPGDDEVFSGTGSAYMFRYNGSTWDEEEKITAFDAAQSDNFARQVAISGDALALAAPNDEVDPLIDNGSGSVYTYRYNGSTWSLDEKLTASDAAGGDRFGQAISLEGDRLAVGAYRDDTAGADAGSVYYFEWNGSSWDEIQEMFALDASAGARFGQSVALSGDYLVVGAYLDSEAAPSAGAGYVFRKRPNEWLQDSKFTASDAADSDNLGENVAAHSGYALFGASADDGGVGVDEGSAYFVAGIDDCNGNNVADACDVIADPGLDLDNNGVIDACDCPPSSTPELQTQFAGDLASEPKMRYIAVTAGDPAAQQSIRVTWDAQANWPGGYPALVGQKMYMTQPIQVCENSSQGLAVAPPDCGTSPGLPQRWFWAAALTCNEALSWFGDLTDLANYCTASGEPCTTDGDCSAGTCGVDGAIHLYHGAIGPSRVSAGVMTQPAEYSVQVVDSACSLDDESSYSAPLVTRTSGWGDLVGANVTCPGSLPNNQADLLPDVTSAIQKFSNLACAPKKTRVDVDHDFVINFPTDLIMLVNAFGSGGGGFSETAPAACPAAAKAAENPRVRR